MIKNWIIYCQSKNQSISQGKWKVKNESLQKYNKEACGLVSQFEFIAMRHIRREFNKEADRITNEVVKNKESFIIEYEYI